MAFAAPSLGAVIVTRDRRDVLLPTLDRLAELPEDPPVVVVDNGSSDGTPAAVRRRHPDVEVVRLAADAGATARTIGVEAVGTQLVAFSDDDSWWRPGALGRAVAAFAAHERLGLLAARILVEPGGHLDPTCATMARSPLPRDGGPGTPVLGFLACGAVVRTTAFLEAGGFRSHAIGGEEHLLALDLAAAGWLVSYVEGVVAHHAPPGTVRSERRRRELESAYLATWLRRRAGCALGHTLRLLRQRDSRRDRWGAFLAALAQAPRILRERKPLPPDLERRAALLDPPGVRT